MKTTRLQHARLVTKAFSVVSNRFGIRERSAFLRRRAREGSGAGEWERAAGSGGGRHTAVANDGAGSRAQFAAAWPPPSALSLSRCALPDPRFVFCDKRPHIEKKNKRTFWITCDAKGLRMRAKRHIYLFCRNSVGAIM